MRVVNPVTPGLGGPQVNKAAGWLARTGIRFSGDGWIPTFFVERGSQGHRHNEDELGSHSDRGKRTATSFFSSTLWDEDRQPDGTDRFGEKNRRGTDSFVKGLILAQNERWRRGLGMQVERAW